MIDSGIRDDIVDRLQTVAAEEGVTILLAVESGSRAWGFASPDSDYDVRFIYAHPPEWYLSLFEQRDVIERPIDAKLVDLAGWDVRKALRLQLKSNATLYEWFTSPIAYLDEGRFRPAAKSLFERHANPRALAHHYFSVARGQWQREIETRDQVKLKKYFYAVRPLLSLRWLATCRSVPPMELHLLLAQDGVPAEVRSAIAALLDAKRQTMEFGTGPHIPCLDSWILDQLGRFAPDQHDPAPPPTSNAIDEANLLLRSVVSR